MLKLKIRDFKNSGAFILENSKSEELASLLYTHKNKKSVKKLAKKLKKQLKKIA